MFKEMLKRSVSLAGAFIRFPLRMSVPIKFTRHFINNQYVDSVSGKTFATINPSTGEELAQVAEADDRDIDIVLIF